jgi:glycosyltransferase involved in cell wall biosynthesis
MSLDICFFAWNRLAFTQTTFALLLANTDWSIVDRLLVFDDGSIDGTREWLDDHISRAPVPAHLVHCGWGSPVKIMNHYLDEEPADLFVKLDNDIAVPPGWLDTMADVLERNPDVELLGMESGQTVMAGEGWDGVYRVQRCSHTGGVGLFRSSAFLTRPRPVAHGRFGFDSWQEEQGPVRAWITPDLHVPQLDRIPEEPWLSLSAKYVRKLWARPWGTYDPSWQRPFYDWIAEEMVA